MGLLTTKCERWCRIISTDWNSARLLSCSRLVTTAKDFFTPWCLRKAGRSLVLQAVTRSQQTHRVKPFLSRTHLRPKRLQWLLSRLHVQTQIRKRSLRKCAGGTDQDQGHSTAFNRQLKSSHDRRCRTVQPAQNRPHSRTPGRLLQSPKRFTFTDRCPANKAGTNK